MSTGANRWRVLYHLARADFLERVRRYSYLLTLALACYLAYGVVAGKVVLRVDNFRGVYNSAWIGVLVALVAAVFLTLAGFYVVKNTVDRDRQTRVGQILATTPISKPLYVLGKGISNFVVLATMLVVLGVAGVGMQLWRAEDLEIHATALFLPLLLIGLPAIALAASLAVLFETIAWLRGGFGNVVYFFVWTFLLTIPFALPSSFLDWTGIGAVWNQLGEALKAQTGSYKGGFTLSIDSGSTGPLQVFHWDGLVWTPQILFARLAWFGIAAGLLLLAAMFFDRFDPAGRPLHDARRKGEPLAEEDVKPLAPRVAAIRLTPLAAAPTGSRFVDLVSSELRLTLKGQKWWWYTGAAGLIVGCLVSPIQVVRSGLLPVAWIWPILLWSVMGTRETRFETSQIVFSSAHSLRRQFPALWLSGVLLALVAGSGALVRLLLVGDGRGVATWLAGGLFIPAMALSLGVWSGSSKAFEILFTLLWYIGPLHAVPGFDFVGVTDASATPRFYFLLTVALLGAAFAGRRRQLQV